MIDERIGHERQPASGERALLAAIEERRSDLTRDVMANNAALSRSDVDYCVQRIVGGSVLLRICEQRGLEDRDCLLALANGPDVYGRLRKQLQKADARYKRKAAARDGLPRGLQIDDHTLGSFLQTLYPPQGEDLFSALPADILGRLHERSLGEIKAGGVFYTPSHVVDCIVEWTVGKLLEGKTVGQVAGLRIVDPACGGGAFLLGAYAYLLDWHLDFYTSTNPARRSRAALPIIVDAPGGDWTLTTAERQRILTAHVFGVDIDPEAVETAKLSLQLKALENGTENGTEGGANRRPGRGLPDLADNIKCGNSLLGPDFVRHASVRGDDAGRLANPFDWDAEFAAVFEAGGFHAVIGNPPYGAALSEFELQWLSHRFEHQQYPLDSYLLFLERSLEIATTGGLIGMIIPNTWLLNLMCSRIRRHIFDSVSIEQIVHYQYPVFPHATVDTQSTILRKTRPPRSHELSITIVAKDGTRESYKVPQQRWRDGDGRPVNIMERPEMLALSDRLQSFPTFGEVCRITQGCKPFQVGKGKPRQTREIVDAKPFVSTEARDRTFRPLLRGSLIGRYRTTWKHNYFISFGDWLAEPRHSADHDAPAKLVVRQTGDSLVATLDDRQFVVRDNLYTLLGLQPNLDLRFVLGVLNSSILNWFYQCVLNPERGEALAQVKRGHLARLPFPMNGEPPAGAAGQCSKVGDAVSEILDLNNRKLGSQDADHRSVLDRQIKTLETRIDDVVGQLFGLDESEMAIVRKHQGQAC